MLDAGYVRSILTLFLFLVKDILADVVAGECLAETLDVHNWKIINAKRLECGAMFCVRVWRSSKLLVKFRYRDAVMPLYFRFCLEQFSYSVHLKSVSGVTERENDNLSQPAPMSHMKNWKKKELAPPPSPAEKKGGKFRTCIRGHFYFADCAVSASSFPPIQPALRAFFFFLRVEGALYTTICWDDPQWAKLTPNQRSEDGFGEWRKRCIQP